ncbi:MAG TPA: TylF/MycF/NovP-related O-methyltransferase [Sphingomicrobium sp.]|nr:TylF/MycF/NovP-related O-methyltransferase [Sphingomicrobium sp.]
MDFRKFGKSLRALYDERRLFTLKFVASRLIPDYRLTWHQMGWWHDADFNAYLDRFDERWGFNSHRRWMLWQLLRLIDDVPGDTAECGVFKGASSWLICAATQGQGRTHHLFDSFEGLSTPEPADGKHWEAGALAAGKDIVLANLRPFADRLKFYRGWIPDRFAEVADKSFALVHVDVDLRQPTLDSVEFFYARLEQGGILLCDDYGCTTCPGATEAIDAFLADKPEKMISLDAGGGFFIKGKGAAPRRSPEC